MSFEKIGVELSEGLKCREERVTEIIEQTSHRMCVERYPNLVG